MEYNQVFSGRLNFLSLADVIQILGTSGCSGQLQLHSKFADGPGFVYISKGNPIHAVAGKIEGLDALYTLFGWKDGTFEFFRKTVQQETTIRKNRMEIILDGLRLLDDGQIPILGPSENLLPQETAREASGIPLIKGPLVDYMYVVDEECYENENVVIEGRYGSWIWVILEGVAEIIKDTPRGPITILRLGEGAFIGNLSSFLLHQHFERTYSAKAIGRLQLGVLDSQRLSKEFAQISSGFRGFVLSLNNRLIRMTNRVVDLSLNKPDASPVYPQQIIKQGNSDEQLFQITDGCAIVSRSVGRNQNLPLVRLEIDDYFGYVPFLDTGMEPYGASVFASENLKAAPLDINLFDQEFNRLSTTFRNMLEVTASSISIATKVACEFFNQTKGKTHIK
jgi:CRP-like cAMP-binding protein